MAGFDWAAGLLGRHGHLELSIEELQQQPIIRKGDVP
jgi:hypothetical protein